ncbi:MAG: hypothetical protein J0I20_04660 [Chloroflexi bacterium]|nr:hypothetical protein [Chloroflexota bacterium]OJW04387.1 MAG: hypothetical protein BGO39_11570 [Chloroflexi bacterium 54-19]
MDQAFDGVEYTRQDTQPDFGDFFETEFASQELKTFQVASLLQEIEYVDQPPSSGQRDDALLPA